MLLPKRTKFRKIHRGRLKGVSKANKIVFGEYGIQVYWMHRSWKILEAA